MAVDHTTSGYSNASVVVVVVGPAESAGAAGNTVPIVVEKAARSIASLGQ